MGFMKLNNGENLRKETGLAATRIIRFIIGNPLIMTEMANMFLTPHPTLVTILIDEL